MTSPSPLRVLLIEDTPTLRMIYEGALSDAGYTVREAATAEAGLAAFHDMAPDIVLLDMMLPDRDGLSIMAQMRADRPATPIIVITAHGSIARTVEAMRAGAQNFLVKPFDEARLIEAVEAARATLPNRAPSAEAGNTTARFLGESEIMQSTYARLRAAAQSHAPIFITGESGTGKALAARTAHELSPRAAGKFIRVPCAGAALERLERELCGYVRGAFPGALSDKVGAVTLADGGTLFFDDVCELSPPIQAKLLGFMELSTVFPLGDTRGHKVDIRVICATSRDPLEELRAGRMREDLYYRLHVVPLAMPPLRMRGRDISLLAQQALARISREEGRPFDRISEAANARLMAHPWPGNVRQLINMIRVAVVMHEGPVLEAHMLEPAPQHPDSANPPPLDIAGQTLAQIERGAIEAALQRNADSVPRAARELDVAPSTLYRKISGWTEPH